MPGPVVYSNSSSLSSLPSKSRAQVSQIAKAYRQAAQLFLTRRLPEAYSTIEPVITPRNLSSVEQQHQVQYNESHGDNLSGFIADSDNAAATACDNAPAPVASASRGTRVKVWSFYLTFLNAVVELGPEEGKLAFGSTRWKALVSKARDGSVWEDVVRDGYHGDEGMVDGDVVVNLATLLLTHSSSQKLNQQRLETYLATSPLFFSSFNNFDDGAGEYRTSDVAPNLASSRSSSSPDASKTSPSLTSTEKTKVPSRHDLDLALKIVELYALHVLPRNDEWEYAREFIQMNGVLDEERRQAFLIALHVLREEERLADMRGAEKGQTRGRRSSTKMGEKKYEKNKQNSVPASVASNSSHEFSGVTQNREQETINDADSSPLANITDSSLNRGSNLKPKLLSETIHQQQRHQQEPNRKASTVSQSTLTPSPTNTNESKVITGSSASSPTSRNREQTKTKQISDTRQLPQPSENRFKEVQERPTQSSSHQTHQNKNTPFTRNNNNPLTKILNSLLPQQSNASPVLAILSALKSLLPFAAQNYKNQSVVIKSILYILAVLTGMGIVGSAAAAAAAAASTGTRTSRRQSGMMMTASSSTRIYPAGMTALPVRMRHVLRLLKNVIVLIWMSVKRTVGMGVAVSYV